MDYPTLMAEAMKQKPAGGTQKLAPFAMAAKGVQADTPYGGLLDSE